MGERFFEKRMISTKPRVVVHFPADRPELCEAAVSYWRGHTGQLAMVRPLRKNSGSLKSGSIDGFYCYFKELKPRNRTDAIKTILGIRPSSRALRILRNEHLLVRKGFHAPPPCFAIEKRIGWFALDSVYANQAVDAMTIRQWCTETLDSDPGSSRKKRQLIGRMAVEIAKLHRSRIFHGEMNLENVLCKETGESFLLYFIDNERTRRCRRLSRSLIAKNLSQLNRNPQWFSLLDRLRFFLIYCRRMEMAEKDRKRLFRKIKQPAGGPLP